MSKVKVTGPINAVTVNQPCLRNWKAYLANGWSTMTLITEMRGELQPESSGSQFKPPLAGAGHSVAPPLQAAQLVIR